LITGEHYRLREKCKSGLIRSRRTYLRQIDGLASLGALTAGIAHEIKNPLNFVTNFAELSADLSNELGTGVGPTRGPPGWRGAREPERQTARS
jgi:signal transduction histidine kinase